MSSDLLQGLSITLGLGIAAQWIAWRLHRPAILFLLFFGIFAGPIFGILDPDALFGSSLIPLVSLSVGIILFEGGLDLKLSELPKVGGLVTKLVTVGMLVTWLLSAVAVWLIFETSIQISILLGSILVVTGPTVIIPLLRHIRLKSRSLSGTALKWEGIVIDPIGAVLAVLVLEAIIITDDQSIWLHSVIAVVKTIVIGGGIGAIAAGVLLALMRVHLIPEHLQNFFSLAFLILAFFLSNELQHESGLLATTLMGFMLANQNKVRIKQIVEFKETLRVLLISGLFILLSARMELSAFSEYGPRSIVFVLVLVFVVRPISVYISTYRSDVSFKDIVFLSSMAPRGIVAASVASIFALQLSERGMEGAEILLPVTFMVIIGTVMIYGLFSPLVAKALDISRPNPQGLIMVGAHKWSRDIALALTEAGGQVFMVDTNRKNIEIAKEEGLSAKNMNIVFDSEADSLVLDGIGKLVALTPNDEINTLASIHFSEIFGPTEVYQLANQSYGEGSGTGSASGRVLFYDKADFFTLQERFNRGAKITTVELDKEINMQVLKENFGEDVIPMFAAKSSGDVVTFTASSQPRQLAGSKLICMVGGT